MAGRLGNSNLLKNATPTICAPYNVGKMNATICYCSACGAQVEYRVPPGDHLPRAICRVCQTVHYSNPKLVVGTLPFWEDKVLLCRRAINPRYGFWVLPAGFMENNESLAEAALRETQEETGAHIELGQLFSIISIPQVSQVHVFFLARLLDCDFNPGVETLELALLDEAHIFWRDIAFRTTAMALQFYFLDRSASVFRPHIDTVPTGAPPFSDIVADS